MVCKKCGKEFEGVFCPYCGERNATELPPECPVCSTPRKDQEKFCSNCGYSYYGVNLARLKREEMAKNAKTNAQNAVTFVKKHRTPFIAAAVLLVLVLIVVIPTTVWAANIFRIGKVDQISIGMSQKEVIDKLGMPYDYSPNSSGFSYYSNNYLKLKEKLDSLDLEDIESFEELEDAIINEEKYREELENTVYDYIYIGFDGDGLVDSVFFDNEKCDKDTDVKKRVKDSELITESVVRYQETPVYYRVEYTDGSLYKGLAKNVTAMSDSYTLEWTDRYGNDFQDRVEVTPNSEIAAMGECGEDAIYVVDVEGVMTISGSGTVTSSNFKTDMHLEKLIIEEGITAIGGGAFSDFGMTEVVIPDSVTSIGTRAFDGCSNLTSVVIPDSVISIGGAAFDDCSGLTSITIPFVGERADGTGSTRFGYIFDYYAPESLKEVVITGGESIGDRAFEGYNSLTSVTIPDSVTNISENAFYGCGNLESIAVEEGNSVYHSDGNCLIETESKMLLRGCNTSIIPDDGSVTSIGDCSFEGCSGLTSVTIPDSVTGIGSGAFYGCSGLTSIVIPDNVTSIGEYAFYGCSGLTSITIPFVGEKADGTGSTHFGYIFGASSSSYNDDCVPESLKEVIIIGGASIGSNAFRNCSGLTSIAIPDSVTSIGGGAFVDCESLTTITIPGTVTELGDYVFKGCTPLGKIIFNGTIEQWGTLESSSSGNDKLVVECTNGRYRFFVTYDLDGGVNAASNPSSYTAPTLGGADGSIALDNPSKVVFDYASNGDGSFEVTQNVYTFLGWYKDPSFEQKVTSLTLDLGDVTLYAKWSEPASQTSTVQVYTREGDYIYFGEYPQTLKASDVTVGDVADEDGYYLGSDGERYAKVVADPYGSGYTFSDGSDVTYGETYYFKVEPIRWRILSESDGSAFILADGIIVNHYYHHPSSSTTIEGETVYANNYKHSDIRAWLNDEFLNTAFGEVAQGLIETTEVDNSASSVADSRNQYVCENTFDKVFLLSYREVTNSDYGFSSDYSDYDTARQMTVSDYARSTGVDMSTGSNYFGRGIWWLRSPSSGDRFYACYVDHNGYVDGIDYVGSDYYGVVPAMNIKL